MSDQPLRESLEALRGQPEALIALIVQQAAVVEQLRAQVAALEARLRDLDDETRGLQQRVEEAERTAARQAAPFRRDPLTRVAHPRRPGRPPGHPGRQRRVPPAIDQDVFVPLTACPSCGGPVTDVRACVQYIEEIPPVRPHVTRVTTQRGRCRRCACAVHSTHPMQVSGAHGAAGVHLGPRALALAADLHTRLGLTMRRTCEVLRTLAGLGLTPGGLAQALRRLAAKLTPAYDALLATIRAGPVVHSDETSWWVNGPHWWLWVAATPDTTVYRVAQTRGRVVVEELLGPTFTGVLVSDCLAVYDGLRGPQQKCYAHHLKAVRAATRAAPSAYLDEWRRLLQTAMALKTVGVTETDQRQALETWADRLIAHRPATPAEQAICHRLAKQRDHLFTFLDHPLVDPTNNLAERQLRPAVIARKLSCGNKTPRGARTWEILASLATTCDQRDRPFIDLVATSVILQPAR